MEKRIYKEKRSVATGALAGASVLPLYLIGKKPLIPYRHTQIGYMILLAGFAVVCFAVPALALGRHAGFIILALGVTVVAALLFCSLTIEVSATDLQFRFGVGVIRRRISITEIESWQETRTSIFFGWGIHLTPRGWLYNVYGFSALEIVLRNGKRIILGTDEPSLFSAALDAAKRSTSDGAPPTFGPFTGRSK